MIRNFLRIQHTWLDNWRKKKKKRVSTQKEQPRTKATGQE